MSKSLYFVPVGGLGNRMQALVAAYHLWLETRINVQVIWFRDWALNAPFHSIFNEVDDDGFTLREARWSDYLLFDRPRKHNLYLPLLPQKLFFSQRIVETQTPQLKADNFDFLRWAKEEKGNLYFSCYESFGDVEDYLYGELLHPTPRVWKRIRAITEKFSSHTIGLHIRRTDNQRSIENSPLYLFEDKIKEELQKNPETCVFLATDDEPTKKTLTDEFPSRIITSGKAAVRGTIEGIQDALAEMYALASCSVIYGSEGSSFSQIAARLKETPLVILKKIKGIAYLLDV
ncbi:MAG: hypothetical protein ACOYJG_08330 [Prevotella sp.]|jgi:hypothetical protein